MFLFLWQSTFRLSDVGIGVLLKFFSILLGVLAKFLVVPSLKAFAETLPTSVTAGKKLLGTNSDDFIKFVCCPDCSMLGCHSIFT